MDMHTAVLGGHSLEVNWKHSVFVVEPDAADNAEVARKLIEDHFMRGARDVDYSIAILRYDPVERYRSGKIDDIHELGRFTKP